MEIAATGSEEAGADILVTLSRGRGLHQGKLPELIRSSFTPALGESLGFASLATGSGPCRRAGGSWSRPKVPGIVDAA